MRLRALVAVLAISLAAAAHAQTPPASLPLPDAHALPSAPTDLQLPGVDRRECGPTKWSALCAAGRWTQFSRLALRVSASGFTSRYELEFAENGELHATYREHVGKLDRAGEIVLFGRDGFAYRSRDKFPDTANVIDYTVSTPIAMAQLASILLDLGVLGPPSDVTGPQSIAASNETQYIRTAAPRKVLLYGAPWSMTGKVKSAGADQVGFDLRLRFRPVDRKGNPVPGKTDTITLEGVASFAPRRPELPDSMDLAGWRIMRAGQEGELKRVPTLAEARGAIPP